MFLFILSVNFEVVYLYIYCNLVKIVLLLIEFFVLLVILLLMFIGGRDVFWGFVGYVWLRGLKRIKISSGGRKIGYSFE